MYLNCHTDGVVEVRVYRSSSVLLKWEKTSAVKFKKIRLSPVTLLQESSFECALVKERLMFSP